MRMERLIILIAFGFINLISISVNGQIHCETYADQKLVCSAQHSGNILNNTLFSNYYNITEVSLKNCGITDIEDNTFKSSVNLKSVDLSINSLTEIKLGLLEDNTQLTYLNLSHNKLTTLPDGIFDETLQLELLDLSKNKIDNLPLDLFDYSKNLTYLDLSSNLIVGEDINLERIFSEITLIEYLDLSRNDLSGTPAIIFKTFSNLKHLNLHKCLLDEVPNFVIQPNMKTIQNLDLSTNHIAKLVDNHIFRDLYNLMELSLADNVINDISEEVFQPMIYLETLNLKKNRLESLSDNLFQSLRSLNHLDLSFNDIEYVPVTAFSGTKLKTLNLAYNRFSFLDSRFLLQLRNLGVGLYAFYFNDNPWQCACLNEVLIEAKMYDVVYKNIKYNGFHPVCVTSREFECKREPNDNSYFINMYQNDILIDR